MIKYVNIEFSNQCVLQPPRRKSIQSNVVKFVDVREVQKDQLNAVYFDGYAIAPSNTLHLIQDKNDANNILLETVSKCVILREGDANDIVEFRFDESSATLLRLAECVRKFVLQYELSDTLHAIWPWYRNTFHMKDIKLYNDKMVRYNLTQEYNIEALLYFLKDEDILINKRMRPKSSNIIRQKSKIVIDEDQYDSIRHKRKFAAAMLLQLSDILRNLNVIRNQLYLLMDDLIEKACEYKDDDKENETDDKQQEQQKNDEQRLIKQIIEALTKDKKLSSMHEIIKSKEIHEDEKEKEKKIKIYIKNNINNIGYWYEQIKKTNQKFKKTYGNDTTYCKNIKWLDIDKCKLPLFTKFMHHFFIESDKEKFKRNTSSQSFDGQDHYFVRVFIDFWRNVPKWFTYEHDILLLELVLRNGINSINIIQDLTGDKCAEYELRIGHNAQKTFNDPFCEFKGWIKSEFNVLHRLKYVTNTILTNLQNDEHQEFSLLNICIGKKNDVPSFSDKSDVFSKYQQECHINFVDDQDQSSIFNQNININVDVNDHDVDDFRKPDPFIERNIGLELFQTLQAFDLMKYGEPLTLFIIDKLQRRQRKSYYAVLGELFYALPDPIALSLLKRSVATLQHAKPEILQDICQKIVEGSAFKPSAALSIADFFDYLKAEDMVQEKTWNKYSNEFERTAFDEISKMDSDHFLFVLLTIPLLAHDGKCLIQLAVEKNRVTFLNNERIANVIYQMYRDGHLKPEATIQTKTLKYQDTFYRLLHYPFKFYYSVQGYHWTTGILYMLYLILVWAYAGSWGTYGDLKQMTDQRYVALEYIFWISNAGFVTYELFECWEKGLIGYFNLRVVGETNIMDVFLSIMWAALFIMHLIVNVKDAIIAAQNPETNNPTMEPTFNPTTNPTLEPTNYPTTLEPTLYPSINPTINPTMAPITIGTYTPPPLLQAYAFIFGVQVFLITLRSFKVFSTSQYFGTLIRVLKLMFIEILKFMFVFVIAIVGILFGLWFMRGINKQSENEEYEVDSIQDGLKYIFQVFIGTVDMDGVGDQSIAIAFMVIATLFGALVLTNLLIALMTTRYETVQEQAQEEVLYNQTQISHDLSNRSRLLPPPLNIVVLMLGFIIWCLNFLILLTLPFLGGYHEIWQIIMPKCNIFGYLHFDLFAKMWDYKFWSCTIAKTNQYRYKSRTDLDLQGHAQYGKHKWYYGCCSCWASCCCFGKLCCKLFRKCIEKESCNSCRRTCCCKCCRPKIGNDENDEDKFFESILLRCRDENHQEIKASDHFAKMKWRDIALWYFGSILHIFYMLMIGVGIVTQLTTISVRMNPIKKLTQEIMQKGFRIHHRGCNAVIKYHSMFQSTTLNPVNAITMDEYFSKYEQPRRELIYRGDKKILRKLTNKTLFCPYCYKSFLKDKKSLEKELVPPLIPLFDFLSAILFIPTVWIPLLIIFGLLALKEIIFDFCKGIDHKLKQDYSSQDFDRDYHPQLAAARSLFISRKDIQDLQVTDCEQD